MICHYAGNHVHLIGTRRRVGGSDHFPTTRRKPRTLIFRAAVDQADVHRHLGINDSLPLTELHRVLSISFGLSEEQTPWSFDSDDVAVDVQECVHQYLSEPEDQLLYRWGLWTITLETIDSYVRDAGTLMRCVLVVPARLATTPSMLRR